MHPQLTGQNGITDLAPFVVFQYSESQSRRLSSKFKAKQPSLALTLAFVDLSPGKASEKASEYATNAAAGLSEQAARFAIVYTAFVWHPGTQPKFGSIQSKPLVRSPQPHVSLHKKRANAPASVLSLHSDWT